MSIEHKLIADGDRHEPKGSSLATLNQVLKSNGDGTTFFGFVNQNEISGRTAGTGYKQVLSAFSIAANQSPTAVDTALKIEFGAAQSVTDVSLSGTGTLTFNTAGQYILDATLRVGGGSSSTSIVLTRAIKNGAQLLHTKGVSLGNAIRVAQVTYDIIIDAQIGDTLSFELVRDSSGANAGGLIQTIPVIAGWTAAPSAEMIISKYVGV